MAVGCQGNNGPIYLYNAYNGSYLNLQLETLHDQLFTTVDASGRFVLITNYVIDIYY